MKKTKAQVREQLRRDAVQNKLDRIKSRCRSILSLLADAQVALGEGKMPEVCDNLDFIETDCAQTSQIASELYESLKEYSETGRTGD